VWLSALFMALGAGIAVSDRRYRVAKDRATETVPVGGTTAATGALEGKAG
jgi:hypothetical protein